MKLLRTPVVLFIIVAIYLIYAVSKQNANICRKRYCCSISISSNFSVLVSKWFSLHRYVSCEHSITHSVAGLFRLVSVNWVSLASYYFYRNYSVEIWSKNRQSLEKESNLDTGSQIGKITRRKVCNLIFWQNISCCMTLYNDIVFVRIVVLITVYI